MVYYVEGKAAVDGWLERLLAGLESGGDAELSEGQKQTLEQVAVKAHTFMEYVAALGGDQTRGEWVELIPSAVTALVDAGIKLWQAFRSTATAQREALITRLEALRWPPFDEIHIS